VQRADRADGRSIRLSPGDQILLCGCPAGSGYLSYDKPQRFQEFTVAAVCDICAKGPGFGNNRPWSRKITKRRFDPNIQRVRATVNGASKRLNVCTGCIKAGKVTR
jgi:large subunit ribosomal protein L28